MPPRCGRFELSERLGRGGMGEVWKAWDPELRRWVAVKLVLETDPETCARLEREARAAASLSHPGIVSVLEVGSGEAGPFIVMELVDGSPLAGRRFPPRRAAEIARDAACAIQAAHDARVIHRDLKPANLMLEKTGRVRVLDFGLARFTTTGSTLTASGLMVGTPAYMPPEQARGELNTIDARSDVYGLGATLYELLAGRPPFEGKDVVDLAFKVVEQEPAPPGADPELDAIVLRCLEKSPGRRYPSARDLAQDLDRWLAGRAVRAAPSGRFGRIWRKRLRRGAIISGVAALAAAAVVGIVAVANRRSAAAADELIAQMRRTSAACLQSAIDLRRAGNLEGMRTFAQEVERSCARVTEVRPALAEPHYRVGRMMRAMFRYDDALRAQREALRRDPGYAPALFEETVLVFRVYNARLAFLEHANAWSPERRRVIDIARADPEARSLAEHLRSNVSRLANAADRLEPGELLCARALEAWGTGNPREARGLFEQAVAAAPGLHDAYEMLGPVCADLGDFEAAVDWQSRGLARDPGYEPHYEQRGIYRVATLRSVSPRAPLATLAIDDFTAALAILPDRADVRLWRGIVRLVIGAEMQEGSADPEPVFEAALADFADAKRGGADPTSVDLARAHVLGLIATSRWRRGLDGRAAFQASQQAIEGLLKAADSNAGVWRTAGDMAYDAARHAFRRADDPLPHLQKALERFTRAIELEPGSAYLYALRAMTLSELAEYRYNRGEEAGSILKEAALDAARAIDVDPDQSLGHSALGKVLELQAETDLLRGVDRAQTLQGAIAALERATATDPLDWHAWVHLGHLRCRRAYDLWGVSESDALHASGMAAYDKAEALVPGAVHTAVMRGGDLMLRGKALLDIGVDPAPTLRQAIAALNGPLAGPYRSVDAHVFRGCARSNLAQWEERQGRDPTELFKASDADFAEALRLRPGYWEAHVRRGQQFLNWANWRIRRSEDASELLRSAGVELDAAVAANPRRSESWTARGVLRLNIAIVGFRMKEEAETLFAASMEDFDAAVAASPRDAEAWAFRGRAAVAWYAARASAKLDGRRQLEEARRSYRTAIELAPGRMKRLQKDLETIERLLRE